MKRTKGPWAWRNFGGRWMLMGEWGRRPVVLSAKGAKGGLVVRDEAGLLVDLTPEHPDAVALTLAPSLIEAARMAAAALRSYQYGNASPDLAEEVADRLQALLTAAGEDFPAPAIVTIDPGPVCCRACGGDLVEGAGCTVCGDRYAEDGL